MEQRTGKLEVGETYLTCDLGGIRVNLYPNKAKQKQTDPDFKGSLPLALWLNTKKEPKPAPQPMFGNGNAFTRR